MLGDLYFSPETKGPVAIFSQQCKMAGMVVGKLVGQLQAGRARRQLTAGRRASRKRSGCARSSPEITLNWSHSSLEANGSSLEQ